MQRGVSCSVLDTTVSHKDVCVQVESQTSSVRCGQGVVVHRRGWAVAGTLLAAVCVGEGRGHVPWVRAPLWGQTAGICLPDLGQGTSVRGSLSSSVKYQ